MKTFSVSALASLFVLALGACSNSGTKSEEGAAVAHVNDWANIACQDMASGFRYEIKVKHFDCMAFGIARKHRVSEVHVMGKGVDTWLKVTPAFQGTESPSCEGTAKTSSGGTIELTIDDANNRSSNKTLIRLFHSDKKGEKITNTHCVFNKYL